MSKREQQLRLIGRLRGSLIASSVVGALGLAGYLGASTQTSTAADSTDTGTSTDTSTTSDSGTYFGDTTRIAAGTGTAHAATSGS